MMCWQRPHMEKSWSEFITQESVCNRDVTKRRHGVVDHGGIVRDNTTHVEISREGRDHAKVSQLLRRGREENRRGQPKACVDNDREGTQRHPFPSLQETEYSLSVQVDLSPLLLDDMFLGFAASIGLFASNHYFFGWSFKIRALVVPSNSPPCSYLFYWIKNADVIEEWQLSCGPHRFYYEELKRAGPRPVLSWPHRFRILCGVASSLLYLHEEWEHVVIHRDVKASNVLLDVKFNPRLGNFGLAKFHDANPSTTRTVDTLGYLALELTHTGQATTSFDVYAFGALVFEVVCGRRPVEPKVLQELVLVDWVRERWIAERWADVVDHRLGDYYDRKEAVMAIKAGLWFSQPSTTARPGTSEVVRYLDAGDDVEVSPLAGLLK
ncbi:hypothetical protein B296_00030675 [Ensete ventricosum]|uniref:non-specific serine/threonine protein kinase n=1 Tax=Ensete ventricosum TaxID=4639 RepID=A0A426XLU0_ENSVE|nr:hypothetical protein B296_00030675 [Ensete ventricosum]